MYQNIFIDRREDKVYLWDDKREMTKFDYVPYAYKKQTGGSFRSIYGDELTKVYGFNEKDPNLFESDVPAETRILIDMYEDSDEPSTGHNIGVIDIETSSEGGFPVVEEANREILSISVYDMTSGQYWVFILDKKGKISDGEKDGVIIRSFLDEETMLMTFLNKWQEFRFTIITGWHVDYFDVPYIYNRMKKILGAKVAKCLSPIGACYLNKWNKRMVIGGISVLDYILLYKKFSEKNEPSYSLNSIGKKVVKMDKVIYDGSIDDLYRDDILKFIEYNLMDVKIVVALDKKLQFINLARHICHVGHVPYETFHMSSRYLEGAILTFLRRNGNLVAPNKPVGGREQYEEQMEEDEEGFSGAYVKEPVPGIHMWVFDLDLTSMYPNIVISLNISPDTKAAKITSIQMSEDALIQKRKELIEENRNSSDPIKDKNELESWVERRLLEFDTNYYVRNKIVSYKIGNVDYTPTEVTDMITSKGYGLASNGVMYRQDKAGVIPSILSRWFQQRKDMRKKAAECRKNDDMEGYSFNNQRQQVWKILLNSLYGVLGLPVFRFYDVDNAEAVTKTGVSIIQTTGKSINQFYMKNLGVSSGDWVIYTDTDSCFVNAIPIIKHRYPEVNFNDDVAMTDAIMKVTGEVQTFVNKFYDVMAKRFFNLDKHAFDAKQEVIAKTAFWLAKKRYAQWIIHKEGSLLEEPELEVKGIDVVRTSFPISFRSFMENFLKRLLTNTPKEKLDESILEFKQKVKTLDVIQIAKNTSVKFISKDGNKNYYPENRKPFSVVKGSPAQVKACIFYNDLLNEWNLNKHVQPIMSGQKIKWVYLKQNPYNIDCLAMKADGTDPHRMIDFINKYVDRMAMFEELASKMTNEKEGGIYDVMKWQFPNESMKVAEQFFGF